MTKTGHMIRVDDDVWAALTEQAAALGYNYRGRPNQGRMVEDLVQGIQPATDLVAGPDNGEAAMRITAMGVAIDNPDSAKFQPSYRLADIVASWPEKTQEQWQQEEWKAGRWVKLVLDTLNGQG